MADPNFFGLKKTLTTVEKNLISKLISILDVNTIARDEQKKIHDAVTAGLGEYLKNHNPLNPFNHRSRAQQDLNTLGTTIKATLMVVKKYLGSEHDTARNTIPINSRADYILSALNKANITVTSQTTIQPASQPST